MEQEIKDLIKDRYASLPAEVQKALVSDQLYQNIVSVAQKNKLMIDKMGQFEDEILMLMLGVSEPEQFPNTLAQNLSISKEKAEALAVDAAELIFTPIRNEMKSPAPAGVAPVSRLPNRADIIQAPENTRTAFTASPSGAISPFEKGDTLGHVQKQNQNASPRPMGQQTQTPRPQVPQHTPRPTTPPVPPKIQPAVPVPSPRPITPPEPSRPTPPPAPAARPTPAPQPPAPSSPLRASLDAAFERPSVKREEVMDVGIAPAKKEYRGKTDPYREPIE